MANKDSIDLLNDPVVLAQKILNEQNEALQTRFQPNKADPVKQWMRDNGVLLKDLRDK